MTTDQMPLTASYYTHDEIDSIFASFKSEYTNEINTYKNNLTSSLDGVKNDYVSKVNGKITDYTSKINTLNSKFGDYYNKPEVDSLLNNSNGLSTSRSTLGCQCGGSGSAVVEYLNLSLSGNWSLSNRTISDNRNCNKYCGGHGEGPGASGGGPGH